MPAVADEAALARVEQVVADPTTDPGEKIRLLRRLRDASDDVHFKGRCDTYIGEQRLRQETGSISLALEVAQARENADIRQQLAAEGHTDDELHVIESHDELDAAEADGTLLESVGAFGLGALHGQAFNSKVKRDHGKFSTTDVAGAPKPPPLAQRGAARPPLKGSPAAKLTPEPQVKQSPGTEDIAAQLEEVRKFGLNDWPTKGAVAQKILGDAKDTQELHTVPLPASPGTEGQTPRRGYTAQRKVTHDKIIGTALTGALSHVLGSDHPLTKKVSDGGTLTDDEKAVVREAAAAKRGGAKPSVLFMAGGPASGKTSALTAAPELEPPGSVTINPDDLKEALPEYGQMVEGKEKFAAAGVHEESSDLGKRLQAEAMDLGLNAVVDGTGDSKKGKFVGKMKDMDDAGYEVKALYVTIPTDDAVVRATRRAMKSGRWVPEPEIRSQHKNVSANFEDVSKLPFLKDVQVYDNSAGDKDTPPTLIARGKNGQLDIGDAESYQRFIDKAKE